MSHKRKNLLDEFNKLAPSEAEKLINQYAKSKNKSVPKSLVITYAHDIEKHLDTVTVSCPYCQSTNIIKKGKTQHGLQQKGRLANAWLTTNKGNRPWHDTTS